MKRLSLFLLGGLLLALPLAAQDLGETAFANSGAAEAQEPFLRGLLLLHSFEYDDAREAFQEALERDPDFAMAAWGEAMTHNHPIWQQQETEEARAALERLGETPEVRLAAAATEREKDYLRVAEILFFSDGSKHERDDAFAEAMRRLHEKYPDDLDAAAFYALSLLGTAHEGRDFATYMRAAAVAEQVFDANPKHPGAAHYLIHSYDDPIHAPLGIPAARAYSKIAPAAAHALHMPSHIFVALGLWDDVVAMNQASWDAADARVERKNLGLDQRSYHALQWLAYGLLQQGRHTEALRLLEVIAEDAEQDDARVIRSYLARMRATHLVETEAWDMPFAGLDVETDATGFSAQAADRYADGLVALHTGDAAGAEDVLEALRNFPDDAEMAPILADELAAAIALKMDRLEEALAHAEQAAAGEDALPLAFGPPMPPKPAHELHGEVLLALDRPAEAMAAFRRALERAPRRARSLLGLARAATAAGHDEEAQHAYATLRQVWHRADAALPALGEVRTTLGAAH